MIVTRQTEDLYGTPREYTGHRFRLYIDGYYPDEEPGWHYHLRLYDRAFNDSDGLPIDSVPHGDSWEEAYACAFDFIRQALASPNCVF